ncbi:MAG: hypothetical protein GY833_12095 [Aestuariibacter sp.]|nr:hypothetical protein [Aestuariibacter sp.]
MKFNEALVTQEDVSEQRAKLDESFEKKLEELRLAYEARKVSLEEKFLKATNKIEADRQALSLDDPRIQLGSQAVQVVGNTELAGRDFEHCCQQAAINLARTHGQSLGHYSYCTVTRGVTHGLYQVIPLGGKAEANDIPLFRIEGTPEVVHKIRTGSQMPANVVEAAAYFVYHLPTLFRMGWNWEKAVSKATDLFAGDPKIAEMLTN